MMGESFYVMVFNSTEDTIKTEKILNRTFKTSIMPTPREISKSCGFAIRFSGVTEEEILREASTIEASWGVYYLGKRKEGGTRVVRNVGENRRK